MDEDSIQEITYFRYCGEKNTTKVLELAKKRAEQLGISKIVIASETGRSAIKALDYFTDSNYQLIIVTHFPASTIGPKGEIPIGIKREEYSDREQKLLEKGVKIVQGTMPFAPPSRYLSWNYPSPEGIIDKTLELFSAGTKVAIASALMATDAGETKEGEEIISCAGTYKGLDTALVVKATTTMNFFKKFEVREIIAKPRYRVRKTKDNNYENWRGNIDQYYSF